MDAQATNTGNPTTAAAAAEDAVAKTTLPQAEQHAAAPITSRASSPDGNSSSSNSGSEKNGQPDLSKVDSVVVNLNNAEENDLFAHLPAHEREILKRQVDIPNAEVGFVQLYRFATTWDMVIVAFCALAAIISGALLPVMTIIFGSLSGSFAGFFTGTTDSDAFKKEVSKYTLYFVYLAIAEFVSSYICALGFIYTGEHITAKVRERYLESILRQNIGFFDKLGAGEVTTRITADTNLVQDGISQKVGLTLTAIATFISAFVIGFIKFWKLTLICSSTVFAITFSMAFGSTFIIKNSKKSLAAYALGGTIAEEVLSSIRNATAFGTQEKLARQYEVHLKEAQKYGTKLKIALSAMLGMMFFILYLNYGLAFWMGSRFVADGETSVSAVLTIVLAVMIGAFSLGNIAPNAQAFTAAVAAAAKIYGTIDRISPLDPTSTEGDIIENLEGVVELKNVKHIYPSRPEVTVMKGISLMVPAGKTTALVGPSGSGKSTIVGLVERFYDPVGGEIFLDGREVKTLNLRWLRQQIALVSQEPTLFGTTIFGNIKHGLIGTKFEKESEEVIRERVFEAAKMANAHDFITGLPEGYETNVGERGFLLSGGQKQRIAIARAVVSDPKILLLDEATSALDTKSEGVVQAALDAAAKGRTTIVIAHRLSTIRTADNIVVMVNGEIAEQGTHDDLIEKQGVYSTLVEAQRIRESAGEPDAVDADDEYNEKIFPSDAQLEQQDPTVDPEDEKIRSRLERTETKQSLSSVILAKRDTNDKTHYSLWTLIKFVASFNQKEKMIMLAGLVFSIIAGACQPTQSVVFSKSIVAISLPVSEVHKMRSQANFWAAMYLMLAFVILIAMILQNVALGVASERMIRRSRLRAFRDMLRQDISFFDEDAHTTGALTALLATETTSIAGLSGSTLGTILMVLTTLIACITISIVIGWKLGLVCTATVPVLLTSGYLRFWILARFEQRSKSAYEGSAGYACEATSAIRTVASLTRESDVWEHYHEQLIAQSRRSLISVSKSSILYASSQSLNLLVSALGFWYGATLVANHEYGLFQFFVCFSEVLFGAQSAGTLFSFAPDMGKAKNAAFQLKKLTDRRPRIDPWSQDGERINNIEGSIEFRDVHFRYPTRPEQPVLKGLSLTVKAGQYVALVGASGCGKSTTIALLERFYDPLTGGVYVDGKEVSTLHIGDYRNLIALVSQEPTLYQGTIRENVLLGADREDVPEEAIVQACKDANIYDFIMSLPEGFSTVVGSKGGLLSGGQKQRVAIARALLRNPKILLLDEATSALDSESEKVVQAALDAAAKGRTTVAVAHRLSTIQKADVIYVFDQGKVVEAGTHRELMAKKGRYFELVNLQTLAKTH